MPTIQTTVKSDSIDLESDDRLIETINVRGMMNVADDCVRNGCYNRATKLYVAATLCNKVYPRESKIALIKLAKYCYPNLPLEKQKTLDSLYGETFYNDFKNMNPNDW